jgi:hypothetical protein
MPIKKKETDTVGVKAPNDELRARDRAGKRYGLNRGVQKMPGHRMGGHARNDVELMALKLRELRLHKK